MKNSFVESPIIYNLFPKLAGSFKNWEPHLKRARRMGFNWIFTNPLHLSGFSGSMYSIKDYYRLDPQYLDPDSRYKDFTQLKQLINKVHRLGLRFMVDLVINHTAIDSVLVEQHPDWYKRDEQGKIVNPSAKDGDRIVVWGDLAEIDNLHSPDRQNLWDYWQELVKALLDLGVDGFRCDAAYQVPIPLWEQLIGFAKSYRPEVRFFAESLGCPFEDVIALANAGFDFVFNSSKWWNFEDRWALEQYHQNCLEGAPSVSFAESHDTARLAAEVENDFARVKQRYFFSALFTSGVMMPIGFEFGFNRQLHVVETRPDWWEEPRTDLSGFIKNVNAIKQKYPVFAQDNPLEVLDTGNPSVLGLKKNELGGRQEGILLLNKNWRAAEVCRPENLAGFELVYTAEGPGQKNAPAQQLELGPAGFAALVRNL
ncbi:MAG: alpha-amylase family glycosyl hydrolase [Calditrichia bacterium]